MAEVAKQCSYHLGRLGWPTERERIYSFYKIAEDFLNRLNRKDQPRCRWFKNCFKGWNKFVGGCTINLQSAGCCLCCWHRHKFLCANHYPDCQYIYFNMWAGSETKAQRISLSLGLLWSFKTFWNQSVFQTMCADIEKPNLSETAARHKF